MAGGLRGPVALLALLCGAAAAAPPAATPPEPPTETLTVPGLAAPAQILVDRWGVPHLYAASADDVFFVQGFNAARDRLFQIDLWRRRGLGRLAAAFGAEHVEQDRAARLLLYRGDMRREWQAYGGGAERIAARFVAGINAYIDQLGSDPARLPFEFRHFGYRPEKWQPEDVVRIRSHVLARNLVSEVWRAAVACHSRLQDDEVRVALRPPWQTRVPEGLDPCLPPDVLRVFALATQPVQLRARPGGRAAAPAAPALAAFAAEPPSEGSNAWVVAPSRTHTGRPILASDPHRAHSVPSLRYLVHLNAPGLNLIGGGEPSLPGVSIGHNGQAAFGLTVFAIDQEDLYVYQTRPGAPREYRYRGGWEAMRVVKETIEVRGQAPRTVELLYTRHGPVLHAEAMAQRAYALRAGWLEPGMAPYFGSLAYMGAQNFAEFRRAMRHWGAPAENQVYADVGGNIGWVSGGLAPRRPNWDGLLPVPGDGRYEWAGFWPAEQLPWAYNPAAGWFASANEMNLPADYPYRERPLGFEWPATARQQRLAQVLGAQARSGLDDTVRLQNDVLSVPAARLQPLLRRLQTSDAPAAAAARLLAAWDLRVSGDSAAAALFELWWSRHLGAVFRQAVLPPRAAALIRVSDVDGLLHDLEQPQARFGEQALAKRDAVLVRSLALAWADMRQLGGADPAAWRWDRLHHAFFGHLAADAVDAAQRARLNVGPLPKQGGSDTVNLSVYDPADFRLYGGPSLRLVLDVGAWDNSRAVNAPGQSGDPDSPHYRDLAPLWLKGEYFPLLYSRERVDAALSRRWLLVPAAPAGPAARGGKPAAGGR